MRPKAASGSLFLAWGYAFARTQVDTNAPNTIAYVVEFLNDIFVISLLSRHHKANRFGELSDLLPYFLACDS